MSISGSLVNYVMTKSVGQPEPTVGMGVTLCGFSDRYPGTIIETGIVNGRKFLTVQEDNFERIDQNGMSESQEYTYSFNPSGAKHIYRQHKSGKWEYVVMNEKTQHWNKERGFSISLGERDRYYDFSF